MKQKMPIFSETDLSRIIEMAWEDRTPFEAIESSFGINESQVIRIMRKNLKERSFKLWRERGTKRSTKHAAKRPTSGTRAYCPTQDKR